MRAVRAEFMPEVHGGVLRRSRWQGSRLWTVQAMKPPRSRIVGKAAVLLKEAGIVPGQVIAMGFALPGGDGFQMLAKVVRYEQHETARGVSRAVVVEEA